MKDPKKLAFVLSILQSLPADNETESFWREVAKVAGNAVSKDKSQVVGDWFSAITIEDVHRIKQYLTLRDRLLKINAKRFYETIRDADLRRQLINDFKEMKVALLDNDILEYGRRMGVQLECCFNQVAITTDAWKQISVNKSRYAERRGKYPSEYTVDLSQSFYNGSTKKDINRIEFMMKYEYSYMHYDFKTKRIFAYPVLKDIKFIRDKASHRGEINTTDKLKLDNLLKHSERTTARFAETFCTIIENLRDLHK